MFLLYIEIHFVALQYWAASATSFAVLVFLCFTLLRRAPLSRRDWGLGFGLCFLFLQASLCFLALTSTSSQSGKHVYLHPSCCFPCNYFRSHEQKGSSFFIVELYQALLLYREENHYNFSVSTPVKKYSSSSQACTSC